MVTKKGIAVTAAIIVGVVGASFLVYLVPESPQSTVITFGDAREQLKFTMDRNQLVIDDFQTAFRMWENGEVDRDTFNSSAKVALQQLDMLNLELRESQVPNEWAQSYILFVQALENYKNYIEQAKEYVDYKAEGKSDSEEERNYLDVMSEAFNRANLLTQESIDAMP